MTNTFKSAALALSALVALSGVAHAEGVKIVLTGQDAKSVQKEIVKAAYKVCRETNLGYTGYAMAAEDQCVEDTIAKANADYVHMASRQAPSGQVSSRTGE